MAKRKLKLRAVLVGILAIAMAEAQIAAVQASPKHPVLADTSAIQHLIVIVDENHSYDNVFGTYPGAHGFYPLPGTPQADGLSKTDFNLTLSGQRVYPHMLLSTAQGSIAHGYFAELRDYAHGSMSGYVSENQREMTRYHYQAPVNQPMGYYNYRTVGPLWDYAQHFAMADHWFQPVFGPTITNLLYLVAGRAGVDGHNAYYTGVPYYHFRFSNIGDELSAHGVSWVWYQGNWNGNRNQIEDNPFMFFHNYQTGNYKTHIRDTSQFSYDVSHNLLPAVSFIKPPVGLDAYPGANMQVGLRYTENLVNEVMASPYWPSTAIILTFDESGGWWDHVTPPQISTPDLQGMGPRIPMVLVSPWAKMNYVSHQVYNADSILRFIETNWNLPSLTEVDKTANNLLPLFDFSHPNSSKFYLGTNREPTFPGTYRIYVQVNNFITAQTGTYAPFLYRGSVYMSVADLARNLNLQKFTDSQGVTLQGQGGTVFLPHDHLLYDSYHRPYVAIASLRKSLGFSIKWMSRDTVQLVDTMAPGRSPIFRYPDYVSQMVVNRKLVETPEHIVTPEPGSTVMTSWLPLYDVEQGLKPLGIISEWNGQVLNFTVPSGWKLNRVHPITPNLSVQNEVGFAIDGTLIGTGFKIVTWSSAEHVPTTYVPVYSLLQALTDMEIKSQWNGNTLILSGVPKQTLGV